MINANGRAPLLANTGDAFVFGHRFAHGICLQHDIIPRLVGLIVLCMGLSGMHLG